MSNDYSIRMIIVTCNKITAMSYEQLRISFQHDFVIMCIVYLINSLYKYVFKKIIHRLFIKITNVKIILIIKCILNFTFLYKIYDKIHRIKFKNFNCIK